MFEKEEEAREFATFLEEHGDKECHYTPECAACKRKREYPLRGVKLALDTLAAQKKREDLKAKALITILEEKPGFPWMIKHDFYESDEPLGIMPQYALFELQEGGRELQISGWFFRIEHLVHWGKAVIPYYDTLYELEAWMAKHFGDSTVLVHDGEVAMNQLTSFIRNTIKDGGHENKEAQTLLNALLYIRFTTARALTDMLFDKTVGMDIVQAASIRDACNYIADHVRENYDVKVNTEID